MFTRLLLVGGLTAALAHTLPAHAAIIYACINNSSGTIKIVAQNEACPNGASKTTLSTTESTPPRTEAYGSEAFNTNGLQANDPSGYQPLLTLDLPEGKYLVFAQIEALGAQQGVDFVQCFLAGGTGLAGFAPRGNVFGATPAFLLGSLTIVGTTVIVPAQGQATGQLSLQCFVKDSMHPHQFVGVNGVRIVAHPVSEVYDLSPPPPEPEC
jgi:hypothetical protein